MKIRDSILGLKDGQFFVCQCEPDTGVLLMESGERAEDGKFKYWLFDSFQEAETHCFKIAKENGDIEAMVFDSNGKKVKVFGPPSNWRRTFPRKSSFFRRIIGFLLR